MKNLTGSLFIAVSCALSLGCTSEPEASDEFEQTQSKTLATLADKSTDRLFIKVAKPKDTLLADATVNAAKRGVRVRALIEHTDDFDTTWLLQQRFESNGVDVDVVAKLATDHPVLVADGTAMIRSATGKTTKTTSVEAVETAADRFEASLALPVDSPTATFQSKGSVRLLPMPESGAARFVGLFGSAKKTIDLEIYALQDTRIIQALGDAAARGVRVRVMLEPETVSGGNFATVSKELAALNIEVKETPPAFSAGIKVDHAKFVIIDDRELLIGTGNLVRSGLGGATLGEFDTRDFWVDDTRATTLAEAKALFAADWNREPTNAAMWKELVITPDNADERIMDLIDAAETRLLVENQSLKDVALVDAIVAAHAKGVDVTVRVGFQPSFGGKPGANDAALAKLKAAGIDAEFFREKYLHAKAIVADDKAFVGSQNFTSGGLFNNRELGVIVSSKAFAEKLSVTLLADAED